VVTVGAGRAVGPKVISGAVGAQESAVPVDGAIAGSRQPVSAGRSVLAERARGTIGTKVVVGADVTKGAVPIGWAVALTREAISARRAFFTVGARRAVGAKES